MGGDMEGGHRLPFPEAGEVAAGAFETDHQRDLVGAAFEAQRVMGAGSIMQS
jgi:hypothetical protein